MANPYGNKPLEVVRLEAGLLFPMVGYSPKTQEVVRFHESKAKMKIVCSPARTSKSYSGAYDALPDCFPPFIREPDGKSWPTASPRIWIVAPKYQLAKEFEYLWEVLVERQKYYGLTFYNIDKAQNSPDQGHMRIVMDWGSDIHGIPQKTTIEVRSAAHMQSIQADQADVVIMSEAADQPAEVWEKYVSTRYGRAIMPTTPKIQAEWLRTLISHSELDAGLSIEVFNFDGTCNPKYDWSRYWREHTLAQSRASATPDVAIKLADISQDKPPDKTNGHDCFHIAEGCWASRDPHFAEQFMGRWTQMQGRIYPFRVRPHFPGQSIHVLDRLPGWVEKAAHYASVDHGFDDPSAVPFFAVAQDGTVVLYDLIYERGLTPSDLARKVKERLGDRSYWLGKHGFASPPRLEWIAGDPVNPNVRAELGRVGLRVFAVDHKRQRDRAFGRLVIQDYLSDDPVLGRPKLFIHRTCTAAIDELRLLRRKPNTPGEEKYLGADHAHDAIRYFLTALPQGRRDKPKQRLDPAVEAAMASGRALWMRESAAERGMRWLR